MAKRANNNNRVKAKNNELPPILPRFAIGDVVQLKGGGPQLTVAEAHGATVRVVWFDQTNVMQQGMLVQDCLKLLLASTTALGGALGTGQAEGYVKVSEAGDNERPPIQDRVD